METDKWCSDEGIAREQRDELSIFLDNLVIEDVDHINRGGMEIRWWKLRYRIEGVEAISHYSIIMMGEQYLTINMNTRVGNYNSDIAEEFMATMNSFKILE